MSGENKDPYVHIYIQLQNTSIVYETLSLKLLKRRENGSQHTASWGWRYANMGKRAGLKQYDNILLRKSKRLDN